MALFETSSLFGRCCCVYSRTQTQPAGQGPLVSSLTTSPTPALTRTSPNFPFLANLNPRPSLRIASNIHPPFARSCSPWRSFELLPGAPFLVSSCTRSHRSRLSSSPTSYFNSVDTALLFTPLPGLHHLYLSCSTYGHLPYHQVVCSMPVGMTTSLRASTGSDWLVRKPHGAKHRADSL